MSSRQLIEKYRALVSNIDEEGNISVVVLEVIESHPERKIQLHMIQVDPIECGDSYTLFPHYIQFPVSVGDELLLETYCQEGNPKQEWEGKVLSSGVDFAKATRTMQKLNKKLVTAKKIRLKLWKERIKNLSNTSSTPEKDRQSQIYPA